MDTSGSLVELEREFGEFVIDAHTPETISMARLAEYMAVLAGILRNEGSVHFDRVEPGSLKIKYWTPKDNAEVIAEGPASIANGSADTQTLTMFSRMNDLLEADRAIGMFRFAALVLPFPGRQRTHSPVYGPIDEEFSVEGQLVRIGGKDKTIHAQLQDGDQFYNCEMTRGLAMDMCHHLFGPAIRVIGTARFQRNRDGKWEQRSFKATKFEELDDSPLGEVATKLREISGNRWSEIPMPLAELARLRGED